MAYAQSVAIVVQKYLELICMCMRSFFVLKAPDQNSEHMLNLLTVYNKNSWGWMCVSREQHLELKFLY